VGFLNDVASLEELVDDDEANLIGTTDNEDVHDG
jgi:hypothetical protein